MAELESDPLREEVDCRRWELPDPKSRPYRAAPARQALPMPAPPAPALLEILATWEGRGTARYAVLVRPPGDFVPPDERDRLDRLLGSCCPEMGRCRLELGVLGSGIKFFRSPTPAELDEFFDQRGGGLRLFLAGRFAAGELIDAARSALSRSRQEVPKLLAPGARIVLHCHDGYAVKIYEDRPRGHCMIGAVGFALPEGESLVGEVLEIAEEDYLGAWR